MNVVIQMSQDEELKALPILLRHSPGMILQNGTYVLTADAARRLREEGVHFMELGRENEGWVAGVERSEPPVWPRRI